MLPSDDTAVRAAAVLEKIGEADLPVQPVVRAKIPPPDIQPSLRERAPVPLHVVTAMLGSGLLKPELLPLLGPVALAPGFIVDAPRLRWHAGLRQLVYQCPNGAVAPLDRVVRLLRLGGGPQAAGLRSPLDCADGGDTALPGAPPGWALLVTADDRPRWQRFDVVLATTLYVYEERTAGNDGLLVLTGRWVAASEYGEYRLVDLAPCGVDAGGPAFASVADAMTAADAAVLGEPFAPPPDIVDGFSNPHDPSQYYWVHSAVPENVLSFPGTLA